MKVGSLCTGYGGIELGLALAGEHVDLHWLAEFDPALDPLHPAGVPNLGDIKAIDWASVERVDLVTAGFPCQPVSAAGKQQAQADDRWLWPAVRDALAGLRPDRFLLENVRNLVSIQKGTIWQGILDDLADLGYDVRWLTLGACRVGAAHHRHRVFALATRHQFPGHAVVDRLDVPECGGKAPVLDLLPTVTTRDGDGRGTGDPEFWARRRSLGRDNGMPLDATVCLLPTPTVGDSRNSRNATPSRSAGQEHHHGGTTLSDVSYAQDWGRFADAVARHAAIFGPPPSPTEPNRNGGPRLAPAFAEWLMCLPAGHVTDVLPRNAALRAIGNGVCPPQLAAAWQILSHLDTSLGRTYGQTMTSTSEDVRQIQERNASARGRVIEAGQGMTVVIEHAMLELAAVWREEAAHITAAKRKGHVTTSKELIQAAGRLAGFAFGLSTRVATMPDPAAVEPDPINYCAACDTDSHRCPGCGEVVNHGEVACAECNVPRVEAHPAQCSCNRPECVALRLSAPDLAISTTSVTLSLFDQTAATGPQLTGDATMDFLTGATNTYNPSPFSSPVTPSPSALAVDNPFVSPVAPGSGSSKRAVERLAFSALPGLASVLAENPRTQLSHSFVETYEGCSLKSLLQRSSRHGLVGASRPSWAFIGGNAFHAVIEAIEKYAALDPMRRTPVDASTGRHGAEFVPIDVEGEFLKALDAQVAEVLAERAGSIYADIDTWHASRGGKEGFDWWRVEGAAMVKRYLDFHDQAWRAKHRIGMAMTMAGPTPMVELGYQMIVPQNSALGTSQLTSEGRMDAVWMSLTEPDVVYIDDWKAGSRAPVDVFQLREYALGLLNVAPELGNATIKGRYWLARKGEYSPAVDVAGPDVADEIGYRYRQVAMGAQFGIFTPNRTDFCAGCSMVDYCPAMASS